jgi:hypothetical protein
MELAFIHIGKTGGSTIRTILNKKKIKTTEYHLNKNYNIHHKKYIIWIRNPIGRFVSAFNHCYHSLSTDPNDIKKFDLKHCLTPTKMKDSINRNYIFSPEYDKLFKNFNSANHLAESLTSSDIELQKKAKLLMQCKEEHLFKGIGWYLNNGNFIKNNKDKILFVGKTETMKDDIRSLSKILGCVLDENTKVRENVYVDKSMKYLSPLAIKNIIDHYKNTDYAALDVLCNYGWISKETLESYYKYENI